MVSAPITISSVMLVSFSISKGIGTCGLTKVENFSVIVPSTTLTAPISIILSFWLLNPVVSISKTTAGHFSGCPLSARTISSRSSTRYASIP